MQLHTGLITAVIEDSASPSIHNERLVVTWENRTKTEYSKQEICNALFEGLAEDSPQRRRLLEKSKTWDLYVTNTQYRVVVTMAFMHDVNSLLGRLSKHFQNNQVVVSDVTTGIQSAMRSLDRMLIENGPQLAQFYEDFNKADDHYLGIPLDNVEDGEREFQLDKTDIVKGLMAHLNARFEGYKNHPVLKRMSVFEHRIWPLNGQALAAYGDEEVTWLFGHFPSLTVLQGVNIREALIEWRDLKADLIQTDQHRDLRYVEFWTWVSRSYLNRYPTILKLILVILIIVIDTSCCERGYSLMNRTHTAERNLLKVETVNDLMAIVNLGPDVDDLDVQDMVRRWLEASQKGRKLSSKFNKGFGLDFSDS